MLYAIECELYCSSGKTENFRKEGRFKDSETNKAAFAVKKMLVNACVTSNHSQIHSRMHTLTHRALVVVQKFLKFRSYVHLQVQNHTHTFIPV